MLEQDRRLRQLLELVRPRLDDDPGHDLEHCLRVALWTLRFAGDQVEGHLVVAAALLHDLVNLPKNSPDRARASELSAEAARPLLSQSGFSDTEADLIADAIRTHSYSRGEPPRTQLGAALCDADRLEALGAIGLMRTISTGTRMQARYFHSQDPWARSRPLDDRRFSIDHCFTKLLKLPARMLTEAGRSEASRRAAFLRAFLEQLGRELDEPPP